MGHGDNGVWVDTDQDRSFADEPAMTDYKADRDVGYFGTDNPATPVREPMPFVVQIDGKTDASDFVNIGIVSGQHGSHVAGIIAGQRPVRRRDERRGARAPSWSRCGSASSSPAAPRTP